jgi:hypothetical protein
MTFTFDIEYTREIGADIIKVDKIGSDFTSSVVGSFAEATVADTSASARYDHLVLEENYTPSMLVSPTVGNVATGKSTSNKEDWAKLQNLARAIFWTAEEKQEWKDTEGTTDKAESDRRKALSSKASNPDLYKRSASTTKDVQTKVVEALDDMIRIVRDIKDGDESIYDAGELIVALQAAKKEANRKSSN